MNHALSTLIGASIGLAAACAHSTDGRLISPYPVAAASIQVNPAAPNVVPLDFRGGRSNQAIDYCAISNNQFIVRLKNVGNLVAPPGEVVTRLGANSYWVNAPAIAPGKHVVLSAARVPGNCFRPDCGFSIRYQGRLLKEGVCIG